MKRELDTPPRLSTPSPMLVRGPLRAAQGNLGPARRGLTPSSPGSWKLGDEEGQGSSTEQAWPDACFSPPNAQPSLALRRYSILIKSGRVKAASGSGIEGHLRCNLRKGTWSSSTGWGTASARHTPIYPHTALRLHTAQVNGLKPERVTKLSKDTQQISAKLHSDTRMSELKQEGPYPWGRGRKTYRPG